MSQFPLGPISTVAAPDLRTILEHAVSRARTDSSGSPAAYIPELASVDPEQTSAAVMLADGTCVTAGDVDTHVFTLQSSAKLVLLAGLLSERGSKEVFSVVGAEPSGTGFASLAHLDTRGPRPSNPLINSGAIALSGMLNGPLEERMAWVERWAERLYGVPLRINPRVFASERRTGERNRAIAHLLRSTGVLQASVDDTLEAYFALCSFECGVQQAVRLPALLAAGGLSATGQRILDVDVAAQMTAIMATCGMYDESGTHLLETGMPAKSGVSGVIVAVALGRAGIAVSSPRVNERGGSVRGHLILRELSRKLGWHIGRPAVA